jgi:hypothetical protein
MVQIHFSENILDWKKDYHLFGQKKPPPKVFEGGFKLISISLLVLD